MPKVFYEDPHAGQFILSEGPGQISRDNVMIAASQTVKAGGVIHDNGAGAYVAYNRAAAPAAGVPVAVSIYAVTTGAGETVATAVISRAAEVNGNAMSWQTGMTDADLATAIGKLKPFGIIVRGVPVGPIPAPPAALEAGGGEEQPAA